MSAILCSDSSGNEKCCLLCQKYFNQGEQSASADSTDNNEFTSKKTFQTFDKHLSVTVKGESFCWSNEGNCNPHFCTSCIVSAEKLIRIDEEMEEIQKRLEEFINALSLEILTAKGISTFTFQKLISKTKAKKDSPSPIHKQHNHELQNSTEESQPDSEFPIDTIKPEPEDINQPFSDDDFEADSFHPTEEDTLDDPLDDPLSVNNNEAKHQVDSRSVDKKKIRKRESEVMKLKDVNVKLRDIYKPSGKVSAVASVETSQPMKRRSAEAALRILRSSIKKEQSSSDSEFEDNKDNPSPNKEDEFYGKDDCDSNGDEYQPDSDEDGGEMISANNSSRKRKADQSSRQKSKRATKSSNKPYVQLRRTERGFYCSECDEMFSKTIELDEHSEETGHVNEKTYKCEPCNKSYYRKVDLKYHTREHPPDMRNFTCGICNLEFKTLGGFRKHCKTHTKKYFQCKSCIMKYLTEAQLKEHQEKNHFSYSCDFCDKVYTGSNCSDRLDKHLKTHDKELKREKNIKKEEKKSFVCQVCEDDFMFSKDLENHSESTGHQNEKSFFCSACPKGFFRKCDLKDHERTHTRVRKTYECELCTKIFKNSFALKNHVAEHAGVIFSCKECDFVSNNEKLFNEHMNYHTGETPFPCSTCTMAFPTRRDLSNHKSVEHNEKRSEFECEFCGATFFSEMTLLTHAYLHTGIKPFKCDVQGCTSSFTSRAKLKIHFIKNHTDDKPFACNQPNCEKAFKFKSLLEAHILWHVDPLAAKRYMCEHCGKGFAKAERLRHHRRIHTSTIEKKFKCDEPTCGKLFQYKVSLSRHLLKGHHGHQQPAKQGWPCAQCSYISPNASSYEKHLRSHTGEKPYMCEECGVSYSARGSLTVHMRKAHLGFRYSCLHCDKKFSSKRSMKDHQIIHKREQKTFKCTICNQEFLDKQELTTHQKTQHSNQEKRLKCSHCDARFTKGTNLKIHEKNVHGITPKSPKK